MGCGPSSSAGTTSAPRYQIYHCHGTDYTNYDQYDRIFQDSTSTLDSLQGFETYDSNVDYHAQQRDIWSDYHKQQQKYQNDQHRLEKERREKLKKQIEQRMHERQRQFNINVEEDNQSSSKDTHFDEEYKHLQLEAERARNNTEQKRNELEAVQKNDTEDNQKQLKQELEQLKSQEKARQELVTLASQLNTLLKAQNATEEQAYRDDDNDKDEDGDYLGYDQYSKHVSNYTEETPDKFDIYELDFEVEFEEEKSDDNNDETVGLSTTADDAKDENVKSNRNRMADMAKKVTTVASITESWKALNIAVKSDKVRDDSLGGLEVVVMDTLCDNDLSFIHPKPKVHPDEKFIDKEFPKEKALGQHLDGKEWKRPQDIYPDVEISLFHEDISINDVKQGAFGDCYFLAVLAGLANQKDIMKQIIPRDAYSPKFGMFHCRFWKFGHWVDIYIDDFLPCYDDSRGLCGCKSKNHLGEMWIPLMEKAWAKFNGSYEEMEAGQPSYAYLSLTGGTPELLFYGHKYYKDKFNSESVYNRVSNALKTGSLVVGSASGSAEISEHLLEKAEEQGLVTNHAYTLTAAALITKTNGKKESLIKLRNPWAHKEWNGKWSDKSPLWETIPEKAKISLQEKQDNGEFWMPWDDFYTYFGSVNICHFTPDYDSDGISDGLVNVFCIYAQWKGKLTGSWMNLDNNPKFEFTTAGNEDQWIVIELIEKTEERGSKGTGALQVDLHDVTMRSSPIEVGEQTNYTSTNQITRKFPISSNRSYHIIPSRFVVGEEAKFLMRVFSKYALKIKPVQVV